MTNSIETQRLLFRHWVTFFSTQNQQKRVDDQKDDLGAMLFPKAKTMYEEITKKIKL